MPRIIHLVCLATLLSMAPGTVAAAPLDVLNLGATLAQGDGSTPPAATPFTITPSSTSRSTTASAENSAAAIPAGTDQKAPAPPHTTRADADLAKAQARINTWSAELDHVEGALQRRTVSQDELDQLRATVVDVRTASEKVQASLQPRAKALVRRVAELTPADATPASDKSGSGAESGSGTSDAANKNPDAANSGANDIAETPPPADGVETPSDALARQLQDQRSQLAAVNGVLKQIQVTQLRADELLSRVGQLRRDQLTQRLLTRTPSILEPRFWSRVANDLPPVMRSARLLVSDWYNLIYGRAGLSAVLLVAIALIGTYVVIWPLRRLLLERAARDPEISPTPLRRSTAALAIAVMATIVPMAAAVIFYRGLDLFDLAPDRVRLMLSAIFRGLVFASFAQGMAWALIAPSRPSWRLLGFGDEAAAQLFRLATAAGVTFALGLVIEGAASVLSTPTDLTYATQAAISLVIAALAVTALRTIARTTDPEDAREDIGALMAIGRWLIPLFWVAALAAIAAPIAGYIMFGWFVAEQIVWTISVLGLLHLLLILTDDIANNLFRADTALGRAMRDSLAIGTGAIEQVGVLLSGIVRILLIAAAAVSVLAPWGFSTGDITALVRQALFGFQIGSFTFSLSQVVAALVIFIVGLTITRALQRWLENRYLPHTRLDIGLKSSIRTGFGYIGVIIAGMIAFTYLGLNLQNIAIVAGALSVGIGFGLQSIVNNFVSGVILLAERPIKVGDWIVVGEEQGYVKRINVRATEIETFDRQTVIVPNSDLISGVVKNWMHDDSSGRIILAVRASYDSDPEQVRDILLAIARENKQLLAYPAPVVYFMDFAAFSLDFELRAYLSQIDYLMAVKSDLRFEIHNRFREAGIEIPFPQRDLNIRDMGGLENALAGRIATARGTVAAREADSRQRDPAEQDRTS